MPEYLAPGVYVEETSFRNKTIEGVSTSTAGFIGPARFGPVKGEPELLTSYSDFERIYGNLGQLNYDGALHHNYLAHAVQAFFQQGGSRLYVCRVYNGSNGIAEKSITDETASEQIITLKARYPGLTGDMIITFQFQLGDNILDTDGTPPVLRGARNYEMVYVQTSESMPGDPPGPEPFYWLESYYDDREGKKFWTFRLHQDDNVSDTSMLLEELLSANSNINQIRILSVTVTVTTATGVLAWENLTFHPLHNRSLSRFFKQNPTNRMTELYVPLVFETELDNGFDIASLFLSQQSTETESFPDNTYLVSLANPDAIPSDLTFQVKLTGGNDGDLPGPGDYKGKEDEYGFKSGFMAFEDLEDISIVAAPGSTFGNNESQIKQIQQYLIGHCEKMKYRIAVLDSPKLDQKTRTLSSTVQEYRGKMDSKHAALYYPWITIFDSMTNQELHLPPSGFVAGIYARNDIENGVHKAPANEVVTGAIGLEMILNKAQQDVLNPKAINCFRFFEDRGFRLWGARVITSDPEWKYVNLRRYFAYLERSIDKGTQWVVFENNSIPLWNNVQSTIEDFLYNEWKSDHLMGTKPEEAYFVRCDRTTMTQNDIDNGRLVCLIGVAPVRPAEFVIFRIGQWTADSKQ